MWFPGRRGTTNNGWLLELISRWDQRVFGRAGNLAELGIDEVVTKPGQRVAAAEAMAEVVELVQAG